MCKQRTFLWGTDCFVKQLLDGGVQGQCECLCSDKCYCEDLAEDDECECNGIHPPLKEKMESCDKERDLEEPDDFSLNCNSISTQRSL
jgi:hypothetical protein